MPHEQKSASAPAPTVGRALWWFALVVILPWNVMKQLETGTSPALLHGLMLLSALMWLVTIIWGFRRALQETDNGAGCPRTPATSGNVTEHD